MFNNHVTSQHFQCNVPITGLQCLTLYNCTAYLSLTSNTVIAKCQTEISDQEMTDSITSLCNNMITLTPTCGALQRSAYCAKQTRHYAFRFKISALHFAWKNKNDNQIFLKTSRLELLYTITLNRLNDKHSRRHWVIISDSPQSYQLNQILSVSIPKFNWCQQSDGAIQL